MVINCRSTTIYQYYKSGLFLGKHVQTANITCSWWSSLFNSIYSDLLVVRYICLGTSPRHVTFSHEYLARNYFWTLKSVQNSITQAVCLSHTIYLSVIKNQQNSSGTFLMKLQIVKLFDWYIYRHKAWQKNCAVA